VGAQGLMQVMTGIHRDKYEMFGGRRAAFDPVTNLRVGVQVLKECIARAGSLEAGLKYYVGAANLPHDGGYAAKVLAEQAFLRDVVAGRKVPTTVTLPQASPLIEAANTASPSTALIPAAQASASAPAASGAVPVPATVPGVSPTPPAVVEPPAISRHPEQVALAR